MHHIFFRKEKNGQEENYDYLCHANAHAAKFGGSKTNTGGSSQSATGGTILNPQKLYNPQLPLPNVATENSLSQLPPPISINNSSHFVRDPSVYRHDTSGGPPGYTTPNWRRRSISTTYAEIPANHLDSSYAEVPHSPHRHSLRLVNKWLEQIPDQHADYYDGSTIYYSLPRNSADRTQGDVISHVSTEAAGIHMAARKPIPNEWMNSSTGYPPLTQRGPASQGPKHLQGVSQRLGPSHRYSPTEKPLNSREYHYQQQQTNIDQAPSVKPHESWQNTRLQTRPHLPDGKYNMQNHLTQPSTYSAHIEPQVLPQHQFSQRGSSPLLMNSQHTSNSQSSHHTTPNVTPPVTSQQPSTVTPPGDYANLNSQGGSLRRKPHLDIEDLYSKPHINRDSNRHGNIPDVIRNTQQIGCRRSQEIVQKAERPPPVAPKPATRKLTDRHVLVFPEHYDLKPSVV